MIRWIAIFTVNNLFIRNFKPIPVLGLKLLLDAGFSLFQWYFPNLNRNTTWNVSNYWIYINNYWTAFGPTITSLLPLFALMKNEWGKFQTNKLAYLTQSAIVWNPQRATLRYSTHIWSFCALDTLCARSTCMAHTHIAATGEYGSCHWNWMFLSPTIRQTAMERSREHSSVILTNFRRIPSQMRCDKSLGARDIYIELGR